MKNNTDSPAQNPKDLLDELHALVTEAEKLIGNAATEPAEDALHALRTPFHAAHERLTDVYEGTKQRVVAGARCTDAAIRANPYTALAIAGGIGLLAGILVGRRSR